MNGLFGRGAWPCGAGFALAAVPLDRAGGLAADFFVAGPEVLAFGASAFLGLADLSAALWGMGKSGPGDDD